MDHQFVRFEARADAAHSDWQRIQRQNLVLNALRTELLDAAVITKVPDLYKQFKDSIVTDLSPSQVVDLTCVMNEVPKESIVQESVHPDMVSPGPNGSMLPAVEQIKALLKTLELIP